MTCVGRPASILIAILLSLFAVGHGNAGQSGVEGTGRQNSAPFVVSMLREDGVLVPFAQYNNEKWSGPRSLADQAKPWFERGSFPSTWYFWPSTDSPTVLKAIKVARVESHCQTIWGIQSNLRRPPGEADRHDNIGVALGVKQKVEAFTRLEAQARESADLSLVMKSSFEKAERARLPKTSPRRDAGTPATLQKLYRSWARVNGQLIYYFEAAKQYAKRPGSADPSCKDVSFFQGWIVKQSDGRLVLMSSKLALTDCDMKTERSAAPFGVIAIKDRTFLIAEEHGYEDESYIIFEIRGSTIRRVLEVSGGAC